MGVYNYFTSIANLNHSKGLVIGFDNQKLYDICKN